MKKIPVIINMIAPFIFMLVFVIAVFTSQAQIKLIGEHSNALTNALLNTIMGLPNNEEEFFATIEALKENSYDIDTKLIYLWCADENQWRSIMGTNSISSYLDEVREKIEQQDETTGKLRWGRYKVFFNWIELNHNNTDQHPSPRLWLSIYVIYDDHYSLKNTNNIMFFTIMVFIIFIFNKFLIEKNERQHTKMKDLLDNYNNDPTSRY